MIFYISVGERKVIDDFLILFNTRDTKNQKNTLFYCDFRRERDTTYLQFLKFMDPTSLMLFIIS
jgi:hypothetical protein